MGHGEEHRSLHDQAEACSQMNVDYGDWDEEPNHLSQHHGTIQQVHPLVKDMDEFGYIEHWRSLVHPKRYAFSNLGQPSITGSGIGIGTTNHLNSEPWIWIQLWVYNYNI